MSVLRSDGVLARERSVVIARSRNRNSRSRSRKSEIISNASSSKESISKESKDGNTTKMNRRESVMMTMMMIGTTTTTAGVTSRAPLFAYAAMTNEINTYSTYEDEELKFKLSYPSQSWEKLVGETGGSGDRSGSRQVIAFAPKGVDPKEVNVTVVATPVGADYQRMGSFGSPFEFGFNVVNPMNKPKAKKGREDEVQYCKLIDATSKGLSYFVEYEITRPSMGIDSKQLVYAGIGYDGRVSHLYSTTAQMPRGEEEKWRPEIEKILDSLVLPPTLYN